MRSNYCKLVFCFFFFLFAHLTSVWSLPYFSVDLGLIFLGNAEEYSAPNPVILQGLGATFPVYQIEDITIEVGGLFYGTQYQWTHDRASPADIERVDNFFVLAMQIDGRVSYKWQLSEQVDMGCGGGLSLVFRIPLFAYDNGEQYRSDMTVYFFDMARFLYPRGDFFVDWALVEGLELRFMVQALVPIYNLWSGESVPFWDGGMIQGIVSLRFLLE
jgi:hypothetical protein